MAVLRPLKRGDRQLSRRAGRRVRGGQSSPADRRWGPARSPFAGSSTSSRTTSWKSRPKGFHRLAPGQEVRLRYAYIVKCTECGEGRARANVVEVRCTYDPDTQRADRRPTAARSRGPSTGFRPAMPWRPRCASTTGCSPTANPDKGGQDWKSFLNPDSLEVLPAAAWSRVSARPCREAVSSSSGRGISASTPGIPDRERRSSTGPSPCATRGPRAATASSGKGPSQYRSVMINLHRFTD